MKMRPSSPDETRDRIVRVAGEVFGQNGFNATTVRQITERAGVNVAAVNYHFRDKSELYIRVLREAKCWCRDESLFELSGSSAEQLRGFISTFVGYLLDPKRPIWHVQVITQEMLNPTPALDVLVRELTEPVFRQIRELIAAVAKTPLSDMELDLHACSILGQCLFHVRSRPMIKRLAPHLSRHKDCINLIADNIATFPRCPAQSSRPTQTKDPRPGRPPLMNASESASPDFKEGFQSGFHEGVEQARKELKAREPAPKKDEPKEEARKPQGPVRQAIGKIIRNRLFQVIAGIIVLVLLMAFIYDASIHESTDDAYTAGHIHNISSRVTGTVLEVRVDDNQIVHQGDVLVVLDPTDYQVQVDQARADYQKAQSDLDRARELRGAGAVSKQDYDTYDSATKVAAAKLQDAEDQLAYCTIRAPFDGRIGHKTVESGNRLNVGAALMAVVEDVWVVANFKETQLGSMRPGQAAEIEIDAIPGKKFRGVVDSWAPGSGATFALLPPDNATGNFTKIVQRVPVKIRFDRDSIRGYENRIVPGLSCEPSVLLRGGEENRSAPMSPQQESIPITAVR